VASERRQRLSPEQRRAQLIELGVEMLATRTLDELSVDDIAEQAGISRGLLFHYFASKQDFHLAVAQAAAQELLRRTEPDPGASPVEALRGGLEAFVDYVQENPDNYKSLVRGAASGDAEMRAVFDHTRSTLAQRIVDIVGVMGQELDARAVLAVHGWVAFVEECVVGWRVDGPVSRPALIDLLVKALVALVLAASEEDIGGLVSVVASEAAVGSH
jgi:AcrR family transcriptional regulator